MSQPSEVILVHHVAAEMKSSILLHNMNSLTSTQVVVIHTVRGSLGS